MQPIANYAIKPRGGLWTSTYQPDTQTSAWVDFCRTEYSAESVLRNPDDLHWSVLTPNLVARIYTIDHDDDLRAIVARYPLLLDPADTAPQRIDFARFSQDYDALHLTERGEQYTRSSEPYLWGWDCESTLWMRWCFDSVRVIRSPRQHQDSG
jgi:hypothetical protein